MSQEPNEWAKKIRQWAADRFAIGRAPRRRRRRIGALGSAKSPILFLGDSITEAWELARPDLYREQGFVCRGFSGETTRQIRARLSEELHRARAGGLHLLCGINDVAQNQGYVESDAIKENLAAMLEEARVMGVRTWVGSLTPAEGFPWRPEVEPRPMIAEVNAWLSQEASVYGAAYIDYHALLRTETDALRDDFSHDGVHLSVKGYRRMEPTLLKALSRH